MGRTLTLWPRGHIKALIYKNNPSRSFRDARVIVANIPAVYLKRKRTEDAEMMPAWVRLLGSAENAKLYAGPQGATSEACVCLLCSSLQEHAIGVAPLPA
eukprot:7340887-Pyramimonas_sp.AAC.1